MQRNTSLIIVVLLAAVAQGQQNCRTTSGLDVVIVLDRSGSVTEDFERQKDLAKALVRDAPKGARFGLVTYHGVAEVQHRLSEYQEKEQLLKMLEKQRNTGGETDVIVALRSAHRLIQSEANADSKHIMVVISDGHSKNKWSEIWEVPRSIRADDIAIYAAATNTRGDTGFKELRRYTGSEDRVFSTAAGHQKLRDIIRRSAADGVTTCDDNISRATTKKPVVDVGFVRDPACVRPDLLFVLDSSTSITDVYRRELEFIAQSVERLYNPGQHRAAMVAYGGQVQTVEVDWGEHQQTTAELAERVRATKHYQGTTQSGVALDLAREVAQRSRSGADLLVIVVTDGLSHDDVQPASTALQNLPRTKVFAVGLASIVNVLELDIIAGDRSRVFVKDDAPRLYDAIQPYLQCQSRATKAPVVRTTKTATARPTTRRPVVTGCNFDVLFVVDSSQSVTRDDSTHEKQREVVLSALKSLSLPNARVAMVKYSGRGTAELEFGFDKYSAKSAARQAVLDTQFTAGTTATGDALSFSGNQLNASRPSAKRVIVVVSDGLSQQDPTTAADLLRPQVDRIYAVATGLLNNPAQLRDITGTADHVYTPERLNDFSSDFAKYTACL